MSPKDWLAEQRVRTHNLIVNFSSGVAFGDVTRRYDTRHGIYQANDELGVYGFYEYDSFHYDSGFQATVGIGFSPTWWLEMSLNGGVLLGSKELSTGWEQRHIDNKGEVLLEDELIQTPITAAIAQIEPILRWYLVPVGPVKPYILTGAQSVFLMVIMFQIWKMLITTTSQVVFILVLWVVEGLHLTL